MLMTILYKSCFQHKPPHLFFGLTTVVTDSHIRCYTVDPEIVLICEFEEYGSLFAWEDTT